MIKILSKCSDAPTHNNISNPINLFYNYLVRIMTASNIIIKPTKILIIRKITKITPYHTISFFLPPPPSL